MKFVKLLSLVAFLMIFSSCSSSSRLKKPFYWKMNYQGREYSFLGTMHVDFSEKDLPKKIQEDLSTADLVYFEATEEYSKSVESDVQEIIFREYPELKNKLSKVTWKNYIFSFNQDKFKNKNSIFEKIEHPIEKFHPCLVSGLASHFIDESGEGYYEEIFPIFTEKLTKASRSDLHAIYVSNSQYRFWNNIFDRELEEFALDNKKEIKNLDNAGSLAEIVGKLETNTCLAQLELYFGATSISELRKKTENYLDGIEKMKKLYVEGNEKDFSSIYSSSSNAWENLGQKNEILLQRNKDWFDTLSKVDENKIFVVGGLAHFLGDQSVFHYFKERGARIEKQNFD